MHCCPNCFSDDFLKSHITAVSSLKGKCSFCRANKHFPLIAPSILIDLFQPLFDLYTENINGQSLNQLLHFDWHMFSTKIDDHNQLQLLAQIIDDTNIPNLKFKPRLTLNKTSINQWNNFVNELKHENRFFPKNTIKTAQLTELFDYLIVPKEKNPKYVYRARINRESNNFTLDRMGPPPSEKSCDGRANPKGISYFYGSSCGKTAIAETRPYKSDNVFVAKFKVAKKISLIDLREPKNTISPFGLDDDSLILLYEEHMPFLEHLSSSLSQPVLPHKKELEYLPTQYLCELIKHDTFDGIIFKSSLEPGDNYVFFDDSLLKATMLESFIIANTKVSPLKQKIKI
jgi:RES domain-containing protein